MFSSINKTGYWLQVTAAKFLLAATKKIIVPNFVAVTKPFFPVQNGVFYAFCIVPFLPKTNWLSEWEVCIHRQPCEEDD